MKTLCATWDTLIHSLRLKVHVCNDLLYPFPALFLVFKFLANITASEILIALFLFSQTYAWRLKVLKRALIY